MRRDPVAALAMIGTAMIGMVSGCAPMGSGPPTASQAAAAVAPVVVPEQRDAAGHLILPVNTQVPLVIDAELASNKAKSGDVFKLTVVRDVTEGGAVVIPRGTHAVGAVVKRSGKGTLGKSGKMEVEMRSLDLNGRVVGLTGKDRKTGKGNGAATLGTLLLFGPLAAGVTGTSARYRKGAAFTAYTSEPIVVDASPPPSATTPPPLPATSATPAPTT